MRRLDILFRQIAAAPGETSANMPSKDSMAGAMETIEADTQNRAHSRRASSRLSLTGENAGHHHAPHRSTPNASTATAADKALAIPPKDPAPRGKAVTRSHIVPRPDHRGINIFRIKGAKWGDLGQPSRALPSGWGRNSRASPSSGAPMTHRHSAQNGAPSERQLILPMIQMGDGRPVDAPTPRRPAPRGARHQSRPPGLPLGESRICAPRSWCAWSEQEPPSSRRSVRPSKPTKLDPARQGAGRQTASSEVAVVPAQFALLPHQLYRHHPRARRS